jgi:hypothetical protein
MAAKLSVVLLVASMLCSLNAQRQTGSISGSVTDASQAAVPDASVTILNLDTGLNRVVSTNEIGLFVVSALPAGRY